MGRAGAGGSSGSSHHSGGGHSVSRSSGGHHVGGSRAGSGMGGSPHRAGGGMGSGSFGGNSHYRSTPPPPPPMSYGGYPPPRPPRRGRTTVYVDNRGNRNGSGYHNITGSILASFVVLIVFTAIMFGIVSVLFSSGSTTSEVSSTINREPLTESAAFINDCVVDELGWFDNIPDTEQRLQYFYNKTGVQPFIVLHDHDSALTTDEEKEVWARDYYDANINNENTFLYVYFAEQDTDNDVGYMCYVNGIETGSVMDSEAIEIFWNYIDRYWYSDMSTDDLFVTVFEKTADTIMRVSTTGADVAKTAVLIIGIIVILIVLFLWWKARARREKEKAAETERILKTPMQDLVNESSKADELAKKYDKME